MATNKQKLGEFGEILVVKSCHCPKCKKRRTLKRLPANFKCADLICDFCGYLGQVKSKTVKSVDQLPKTILGAAWEPQRERMEAGIYFPLFLVLVADKDTAVYYLSADLQIANMFVPRKPLSSTARRAGWQGFTYDLTQLQEGAVVRLA
jgi:type II restriction enzyme